MPLSEKALEVVTRPLPQDKIKQRPGKGNMTFNYISADLVIDLLNEAFSHYWSTKIVSSAIHGETAVVGLELCVPDRDGNPICKQQFGSCDITSGLRHGEAFKGATSDALKKAATLLGIGLELYQDDDATTPGSGPRLPQAASRPTSPGKASAPRAPSAPVSAPAAPRVPSPPKVGNPFAKEASSTTARVPAPKPSVPPAPQTAPAPPRSNPFAGTASTNAGPNSTQMNAMTNLASRKNLSQAEMIALANVTDAQGSPVQTFEELSHSQAIHVIKAAQL